MYWIGVKRMKITQGVRRKLVQLAAFGFTNAHLGNFAKGTLYTGKWKQFCAPGLNCYSCPAAGLACPIGALQAVAGSPQFAVSFYVVGFLLALGVGLGRFICGWLCPFGLFQELLHKLPSPKFKLPKWCKYIKYAVLAVFVLALPMLVAGPSGVGDPAFCKYLCPAGTLEGGLPLLATHPELRAALGWLFNWKVAVAVAVIVGSVLVQRFFCKVLCPLGAVYAMLNKLSFYRLHVDQNACVSCQKCAQVCPMDVDPVAKPQSPECIRCGKCAAQCPTQAIRLGFTKAKRPAKKMP